MHSEGWVKQVDYHRYNGKRTWTTTKHEPVEDVIDRSSVYL